MTSSSADLSYLISRGETMQVEFKAAIPRPTDLAREISALSNVGGGWLIIGVDRDAPAGKAQPPCSSPP